MSRWAPLPRLLTLLIIVGVLSLVAIGNRLGAAAVSPPTRCEDVGLSVALAPGKQADHRVTGRLCWRPPLPTRTVHVLLSGAAYGRTYWDLPLRPERYSYVRALTDSGYATLNLDRIGIGASDHPPADQVTVESNAFVVHQIVQALREGRLARISFPTVIVVGHSLGSAVALVEASRYGDVDGVILTGFLHAFGPAFPAVPAALYPAQDDPRFAGLNLPGGYLTTRPGARESLFYWGPGAEPEIVAFDEATKETMTTGEGSDLPVVLTSRDISQGVRVPVLVVVGQYDTLFCTPPQCSEADSEPLFYAPEARLEVKVLPNAGHVLNLHRDAPAWFAIAREWSDRHFGPRTIPPRAVRQPQPVDSDTRSPHVA